MDRGTELFVRYSSFRIDVRDLLEPYNFQFSIFESFERASDSSASIRTPASIRLWCVLFGVAVEHLVAIKMGKTILKFVMTAVISTSLIVGAHVFKDYKNKELVLTSVYDAMKSNLQHDLQNTLNKDEMLHDSRNKRNTNTNDKLEYYDQQPAESQNE